MQMTRITPVCAADCSDLLASFYRAFRFQYRFQMPVKTLNFCAVRRRVFDDDDVSPTRARVARKSNLPVSRRKNRLAAIGISARRFVPIFAEMPVFAEILRVILRIPPIISLADKILFADRISKTLFRKFAEQLRRNFFVRVFFPDASRLKNQKTGENQ
jgi:hypothetical protein